MKSWKKEENEEKKGHVYDKKTRYQEGFQRPGGNVSVAEFLMAIFQQQPRKMRIC